jgi:hypothetical protein
MDSLLIFLIKGLFKKETNVLEGNSIIENRKSSSYQGSAELEDWYMT